MTADRDRYLAMYRAITLTRTTDERVTGLMRTGQLALFWLSARGQEVLGSALGTALQPDDYLVTYYRGLPEQLAKGMSLKKMWAEWMGRATGTAKGKGGFVHTVDPDAGVMVNSGIIGGQIAIAPGLALASHLRGDGRVTICTFGDGASSEGSFHEALNLAAVWKLPVVFVCQNNRYAETTAFEKVFSTDQIANRAAGYGIPGVVVDGNDWEAMTAAIDTAVERARSGQGPTLLEAMTYRLAGHYNMDAMGYMPEEELAAARAADPVPRFRAWLVESGTATEAELDTLDEEAAAEVEAAYEFARTSPEPDLSELTLDVLGVSA